MNHSAVATKDDTSKTLLGFWIYLMTDCLLFASLFATFVILRNNTAGGPDGGELFSLSFVFAETLVLLTSSYTAGLALYYAHQKMLNKSLIALGVTFILGAVFLSMEMTEFALLVSEGSGWASSGFTSAYFTLVGTHGLHIFIGLIWLLTLIVMLVKKGLSQLTTKRLLMWSMFWHFLDIVWIFIFTVVYLMGAIK